MGAGHLKTVLTANTNPSLNAPRIRNTYLFQPGGFWDGGLFIYFPCGHCLHSGPSLSLLLSGCWTDIWSEMLMQSTRVGAKYNMADVMLMAATE